MKNSSISEIFHTALIVLSICCIVSLFFAMQAIADVREDRQNREQEYKQKCKEKSNASMKDGVCRITYEVLNKKSYSNIAEVYFNN